MFFDPGFTLILRDLMPWAGEFFKLITELGSDLFYVALLLIGYWSFRKRESIVTILVLMVAVVTNYWLKVAIQNPRPVGVLYPGYEMPENWSTPSGHAQNSSMLFGWLAIKVKTWWMLLLSIVLTALIGISRVYLGVHYLEDVLLGWGIGIVLVLILWYAEKPLGAILSKYKAEYLWFTLFLLGLFMTFIATYVVLPLPPGDNFGALGGLVMGIAVALPLEARYVQFSVEPVDGQKWRLVLRVVLGLVIVLGVMLGLGGVLPTANVWLRALRYFLVALIGGFVWPAIFKKIKL